MSDERPRPQYGEYATPEQQERAANQNMPQRRFVGPPITPTPPPPPVTAASAPPGLYSSSKHPLDRFATIFMLGIGAFFLLSSIASYVNFSGTLSAGYRQFGAGNFPEPALADRIGIILLIAHSVLYVLTALLTVRRLARGGIAFWIPLLGFVAFVIVFLALGGVLYSAEPAYFEKVTAGLMGTTF